jgi:hypothetical protein
MSKYDWIDILSMSEIKAMADDYRQWWRSNDCQRASPLLGVMPQFPLCRFQRWSLTTHGFGKGGRFVKGGKVKG